jgi:RNA polymerase sigma-70 factor (ECF subfamily)
MTININHIDVELLNRLRENDTQAFESIYKKYWQNLYLTAFSILKDKQAAEDIIQDLFIHLWNKRATISVTVSLNAYLSACVKHEVFRIIRKRIAELDTNEVIQPDKTYNAQELIEYKEFLSHTQQLIAKLSVKFQEVFVLSREDQYTHKEIAAQLNISSKTVENHIGKALGLLKNSL